MAYVAPTWRNGGPPALDAAALQAISDAIVGAESKNASQDTAIATLQAAVTALQTGGAKVEVGSYVGTGTYGVSSPNSLTFSFTPKLVWIFSGFVPDNLTEGSAPIKLVDPSNNNAVTVINFGELTTTYQQNKGFFHGYLAKVNKSNTYARRSGNTVYWYNTEGGQLNYQGWVFGWAAFG